MQPIFEAKYLAIKWSDKNTVSSITEAMNTIPIEVENTTSYYMEVQAYSRENGLDMQVGFRILDTQNDIKPYVLNAKGDKIYLYKIKEDWWIERSSWKEEKNKDSYWTSELWNHAGETQVYFGNIACHIDIRAISFTTEQLNLYLEDFKNDFWWLILKKNSFTQAEARNSNDQIKILNKETINLIQEFIKHIQNILKNPKKELKETQRIKDIKKVKPVAKTFMEIATRGMKRKMTSRDAIESFNVAENRYIHYALYQVYTMVRNMTKASQYVNNFYQSKIKSKQQRVEQLKDVKTINKEVVATTIKTLQEKINKIKNTFENIEDKQETECYKEVNTPINKAIQNQPFQQNNIEQFQQFHIKLERRQSDYQNKIQFFGKVKYPGEENWHGIETNDLFSLEFDLDFCGFLKEAQEFIINANTHYTSRKTNSNRNMHKIYFSHISELKHLKDNKPEKTLKYQTLYIKLNKKQNILENKIQFWGKARLENQNEWQQFKKGDSLSLEFDKNIFNHILQENTEYKITAYIEKSKDDKRNGGTIYKRYFKYITQIEQLSNFHLDKELDYYMRQKKQLEKTNWIR
ncbi:MAG: hypothetical protein IE909_09750, partial [Campylobacterales bacterium]|nr:hypothetical protein [Campylobacterales bacterium]